MLVGTRDEAREFFLHVWRKMSARENMEPLEQLLAQVISEHPEYHATLDDPDGALHKDFDGAGAAPNPFLHMGLHIALIEQLQTDRPAGIRALYQQLLRGGANDSHAVEHRMMECLGESLWQASRDGVAPDEGAYLERLRRLAQ